MLSNIIIYEYNAEHINLHIFWCMLVIYKSYFVCQGGRFSVHKMFIECLMYESLYRVVHKSSLQHAFQKQQVCCSQRQSIPMHPL